MEDFLKLKELCKFEISPIKDLIVAMKDDLNSQFYRLGTSIHFSQAINSNYALVSLIDLIDISPISSLKPSDENDWSPVSSYKWFFLIISIASRQLAKNNPNLERGKLLYVISKFDNFITNADRKSKWSTHIISGAICSILRLAEEAKIKLIPKDPDNKTPYPSDTYEFLTAKTFFDFFEQLSNQPKPQSEDMIKLTDFSERNIFYFCFPYSSRHTNFDQYKPFADPYSVCFISLVKLLLEMTKHFGLQILGPLEESLKFSMQPYVVKLNTKLFANQVLVVCFNGNEEAAIHFVYNMQFVSISNTISSLYESSIKFTRSLNYSDINLLTDKLSECSKLAQEQPQNFISFLSGDNNLKEQFIALLSSDYYPEIICLTLQLLTIGQVKLKNVSILFDKFLKTENEQLQKDLEPLLIAHQDQIVQPIIDLLPYVLDFGFRSQRFFDFLGKLVSTNRFENQSTIQHLLTNLMAIINQSIHDCQNVPRIYSLLSKYIDLKGQFFETSVCLCNFQARQTKSVRIDEVNSYNKFLYNAMLTRFASPMSIKSVQIRYTTKHFITNKTPKTVQVYATDTEINNPNQLISDSIDWRRVCEIQFTPNNSTAKADLNLEMLATALKFQFVSFYEDSGSGKLTCPNCRNSVFPSSMGICPICNENVFSCTNCRLSNVTHVDWFLCAECGNCNYCRLEYIITARQDFSHTVIRNESDCIESLKKCDELVNSVEKSFQSLNSYKQQIEEVLSPLHRQNRTKELSELYNDKCKNEYSSLTRSIEHLFAIRESINKYKGNSSDNAKLNRQNKCMNCHKLFIQNSLQFIVNHVSKYDNIIKNPTISGFLDDLLDKDIFTQMILDDLIIYSKLRPESIDYFIKKVMDLSYMKPSYSQLFIELISIDDNNKYDRIRKMLKLIEYLAIKNVKIDSFESFIVSLFSSPLLAKLNRETISTIRCFISFFEKTNAVTPNSLNLKIMSLFEEIKSLISNETILSYYLIDLNSHLVKVTFSDLLQNLSKADFQIFENAFEYILSKISQFRTQSEFFDPKSQPLVTAFYKLLSIHPFKVRSLLLHNFDFIETLIGFFAIEIEKMQSSVSNSLPIIQSKDPLKYYSLIVKYIISNHLNFLYISKTKAEILINLFDKYQNANSLFLPITDTTLLTDSFLKLSICRSFSPVMYFDADPIIVLPNQPVFDKQHAEKYVSLLDKEKSIKCRAFLLKDEKLSSPSKSEKNALNAMAEDTFLSLTKQAIKSDKKYIDMVFKYVGILGMAVPINALISDVYWTIWYPIKGNSAFEFSYIFTSEADEAKVLVNNKLRHLPQQITFSTQ